MDKTVKIWDLDIGSEVRTLGGFSGYVWGVAMTTDGKRALAASWDNTVKMWDLATGHLVGTFYCDAPAYCCAFVDDQRILVGDQGGRVYILSLEESGTREHR